MFVTAAFHRTGKETAAKLQAPLWADKTTLAGETTDDLWLSKPGNIMAAKRHPPAS